MREIVSGVLLIGLALAAIFWIIPNGVEDVGPAPSIALSPAFWPYVVAVITLFFSVILVVQASIALVRARPAQAQAATQTGGANWTMLIAVLMLIPYYILITQTGLLLSSIVALAGFSLLAGERNYRAVLAWAVFGPLILTVFFTKVAQVLIPVGPLKGIF